MIGLVTVFGGTGFLGRRVVARLVDRKIPVRVASRHVERAEELFGSCPIVQAVAADIHDERSIVNAVTGATAVVNAVSLYAERGRTKFDSVHVDAARRLAAVAYRCRVRRLVHVSGLGADPYAASAYIRSRGKGEVAVRNALPEAIVIRPAVMFGPDDVFLTTIAGLLRRFPVYPLFGRGRMRLQPAYVDDVAQAIVTALQRGDAAAGKIFECAGPRIYSYQELLRTIAHLIGVRSVLVRMPFAAWRILATVAELLPKPPLTRSQVELMQIDNVARGKDGFAALSVEPHSIEAILPSMLRLTGDPLSQAR